ncbi:chromate transporter [Cyanobium gracile]|uniref:Chromate transport protein ChrA n=1 Tax=Cyanobium gracile (strain ATCC 27147 / PCC 6307) TaxID=292564 RepID=K9P863_CYAGP|nr:chromate transporter [Cyanobium gracile]AFY28759.1 chromate transport protein ChrA [Cyanobium gracile PCC 6307]
MTEPPAPAPTASPPGLGQLFTGMLMVALSAFGGGLSAWSQRIIVEQRQWMSNEEFLTGLTVARLFPGPNQINMAVYVGTFFRGLPGALAALAGMLLVPFTLLMAVGLLYFQFHSLPALDRVLAGVVAAAAGMALSMGFKILHEYGKDPVALLLAAVTFVLMTFFQVRLVPLVLVAGPLAMAWYWPRPSHPGPPAGEPR